MNLKLTLPLSCLLLMLSSCGFVSESKIIYKPTANSRGLVRKAMEESAGRSQLGLVESPAQPNKVIYADLRRGPGPKLFATADLDVGEILIGEGLRTSPSPRMTEYVENLRKGMAVRGISPE